MKAMILAAGLGTRLRPLTDDRPKALVEVAGRTLLEISLRRLREFGIREVIVNVHHFADLVVAYLKAHDNFGMCIEISREGILLDTGGGVKKAAWFFEEGSTDSTEPFILHNVDVISTIDLSQMVRAHGEKDALATLAVKDRTTSRYLLFDENDRLCGRRSGETGTPEQIASPLEMKSWAFCGIHVISPKLLSQLTEEGVFSIITAYLRLARGGEKICAFRADEYYWRDLGKPENIRQAADDVEQGVIRL
ncbi:MAG TPA: nucleotidyltransferase family protein [Candidatus Solibacter sp.]|nr:nucleotidyltransferase family protein [Candidatus Solibacter sp.]